MRPLSSLAALVALAGFSWAEPNGWSKAKSAADSPTKLDDCGCWPIYQAMLRCQKLKGPNADTRECVCIDNPDGWYPSMDGCRNCLSPGSLEEDDFFDNMSRLVTQLFVSCTNAGGGVTSDGVSICASNSYREACVSLGTGGQPSWASFEEFDSQTKGNASYVLDIEEYDADEDEDASTSTTDTAVKTTGTAVETTDTATKTTGTATTTIDSATTTETSSTAIAITTTSTGELSPASTGTSDNASGTETGPASATTAPSSSATKLAGDRTVAGVIRGAIIAVVVGAILF
ncbi:hypothetical protein B0J13DRAFT_576989 [Dactylonectria estremocensis]|uniref:Uncharacterized protein n=1 Tax=Dactylonectria estremocensis TaxID=1079267 RepID=A0A9P9I7V3_9HYPO|nr:hypothetical protein B0J13DRAFT_576989 [Dactylonectria estremocensis]